MNKQNRNFKYRDNLIKNPTKSEIEFRGMLDFYGVEYIFQKGFIKGDYHCIVDFYLPKPYKICIEIDGGYHNDKKQVIRDMEKDDYLKSRGFKVLRIKNENVSTFDINSLFILKTFKHN